MATCRPPTGHYPPLSISVVVPTYRRPDLLWRCLHALCEQDFDSRRYEVIVADDAAKHGPTEVAGLLDQLRSRFPEGPALHYLPVLATQGPAGARNDGWSVAQGEVVAFTDDDTIPAPTWLARGWEAMQQHDAAAAAGRIVVPLPAQPTDYERDAAGLDDAEFATANCFVRRRVLEAIGGFDERFTAAWREDSDLFFTLVRQAYQVVRAPAAVVIHPIRPAPWGVSIWQQRKVQFDALLYRKHPVLYRTKIRATPPWHYFVIVLSGVGALVALAAGHLPAALALFAVWAGLTGRLVLRRLWRTSKSPAHVAEMLVTSVAIPPLATFWRLVGALRFRTLFP